MENLSVFQHQALATGRAALVSRVCKCVCKCVRAHPLCLWWGKRTGRASTHKNNRTVTKALQSGVRWDRRLPAWPTGWQSWAGAGRVRVIPSLATLSPAPR